MTNNLKRWMKSAFIVPCLLGAGVAQAGVVKGPMVHEQVLDDTGLIGNDKQAGGNSVALDGQWAFVGNTVKCQVFVYKWNPLTNLYGDGAGNDGEAYTTLTDSANACTANGTGGFGKEISTSNGLVVVGAPLDKAGGSVRWGSIHFFVYDDAQKTCDTATCRKGWVFRNEIEFAKDYTNHDSATTNAFPLVDDRQADSGFGSSVSIRYDAVAGTGLLVAGAPGYEGPLGDNQGKIYVYRWINSNSSITFIGSHIGPNTLNTKYGSAVTSNGTRLLVGAPNEGGFTHGEPEAGVVFLYGIKTEPADPVVGSIEYLREFRDDVAPIPALGANAHLGASVSYSSSSMLPGDIMAFGGANAYVINELVVATPASLGTYDLLNTVEGTNDGDVSQSGEVIDIATKGKAVALALEDEGASKIFFKKTTMSPMTNPTPDWHYTKDQFDFGRDVSLALPRLAVNGNARDGVKPNDQGVAYIYYPTCGYGGVLTPNEWQVIGKQCEVFKDDGVTKASILDMFGPDLGGLSTYDVDWVMYERRAPNYDGRSSSYVKMDPDDIMEVGVGYFIVYVTGTDPKPYEIRSPLVMQNITKVPDALSRGHVGATTDLDLRAVMYPGSSTAPTGRDGGTSDLRVLLANPLIVPADWGDTSITIAVVPATTLTVGSNANTDTDFPYGGAKDLFEDAKAIAWLFDSPNDWWIPVIPDGVTPGFRADIPPGQGFSVNFNTAMTTVIVNGTVVKFHIAEQL